MRCLLRSRLCQAVSQITGFVRDETGAFVPGVQVTVTQTATGFSKTAQTDETGAYILVNLPLGPYRLEAAKMGFRTYIQTGFELQVGTAPEISITLGIGQVTDSVQVEANASQIETRSLGVGTVIENKRILNCRSTPPADRFDHFERRRCADRHESCYDAHRR